MTSPLRQSAERHVPFGSPSPGADLSRPGSVFPSPSINLTRPGPAVVNANLGAGEPLLRGRVVERKSCDKRILVIVLTLIAAFAIGAYFTARYAPGPCSGGKILLEAPSGCGCFPLVNGTGPGALPPCDFPNGI